MHKYWLPLLSLVLLTACATSPPQMQVSQLELFETVQVPEGQTRVFIQQGKIVRRIDEFTPHCALEIRHLHGPPRSIRPGVYPVTRIEPVVAEVVMAVPAVRLAAVGIGVGWGWFDHHRVDNEQPPEIFEGYHYWLQDPDGSLMRLTCFGGRALPFDVRPPSLAELAQALGSYGRLSVRP